MKDKIALHNKAWIAAIDVLLYVAALGLAFLMRYQGDIPLLNMEQTLKMLPLFIICYLLLAATYNLFSEYQKYDDTLASLVCALALAAVINVALAFIFRQFAVPRTIFLISTVLQIILIGGWRYIVWRKSLLVGRIQGVLVVGYPAEIEELQDNITQNMSQGLHLAHRIVLDDEDGFERQWQRFTRGQRGAEVDVIIICSTVPWEHRQILFEYAIEQGKQIMMVPGIYELLLQNARLISAGDAPVIQLQGVLAPPYLTAVKRLMDIVISLPLLILLSPVMLIIALLIKLDSPGQVFYMQPRLGLHDREIKICKFRTMVKDAEIISGPILSSENDPRITRVGHLLRRTRLDEIPQFWNVLKGDMSLVGPRPEREHFIVQYSENIPEFAWRTNIKGGITGLAQVEGKYSTQPENKLKYDLFYAQNQSLAGDLVILIRTAKVLFLRDKAD